MPVMGPFWGVFQFLIAIRVQKPRKGDVSAMWISRVDELNVRKSVNTFNDVGGSKCWLNSRSSNLYTVPRVQV